jgi:hypothetical protein
MPGERVEIIYEASVRGADKIQDLSRKTQELDDANTKVSRATEGATRAQLKHNDALLRAREAIHNFKKELFAITFAIGLLKGLTSASDELAERFEKLGRLTAKILQPLGNALARLFGGKGELSDVKKSELLSLQEDVARLRGDNAEALRKKLEAEEIKFNNSIMSLSEDKKRIFRSEFEERKRLMIETQRLEELGLKRQQQIFNDFKKDLVSGLRGSTGETLFNLFEGNAQSGGDILKNFRSGLNRALSDALSQSLFSGLFGGGGISGIFENFKNILSGRNSTTMAVDKVAEKISEMHQTLSQATDCICRTAENTAAMAGRGSPQISFEPGKDTMKGVRMAGAITGLVATVASIGAAGAAGAGSGAGAAASGPSGNFANISMGPGAMGPVGRYGGLESMLPRIPRFKNGGEVPAILHAGEYVVNAQATRRNKETLAAINSGGSAGGHTFNVFVKANDAKSFDDQLGSSAARARMEIQVIRMIMENGNVRRVMKEYVR